VNAVGTPDAEGFLVTEGETPEGFPEALQPREEEMPMWT
jgi:hypothetical protein